MEDFISNWNYELGNMIGMTFFEPMQFMSMIIRFILNFVVVTIIARGFYFPKSQRRDYMFIFLIMSMSIFMLVNLMGSGDTLNTGAALGLFAIFGIIRYRTEAIPIREMTYLFIIIAMSAINGLVIEELTYSEMVLANLLFIASVWVCESDLVIRHLAYKVIKYDNMELITPDKETELIADLKKRTGLDIVKIEVGGIDFLKDAAIIKMYYRPTDGNTTNSVDTTIKAPSDEFKIKN